MNKIADTHYRAKIILNTLIVVLLLCSGAVAASSEQNVDDALSAFGRGVTTGFLRNDQDGPVNVTYGDVFQKGDLKIEPVGFATLPSLPAAYASLNNKAFRITTTAVVSGPHTIRFTVSSVTEEEAFKKLRILHVDSDPYDPDGLVWVDVTVLNSPATSPSFSTKTICGESETLGVYVIAKQAEAVSRSRTTADLVVTSSNLADRITAPTLINYTIKVFNQGPDNATDVGLFDGLSGQAGLVSAEPSQGKCKTRGGHIVCKLGSLRAGESVTVAVKLKAEEGRGSFPTEGVQIIHDASASAQEKDPAIQNNEASDTVTVFPDPNQPPTVTLRSPRNEALFTGPADITLQAAAVDSDGSISKVEFFDGPKSLGLGTSVDGKNFVLTAHEVSYGNHYFLAVATDDGGRSDLSAETGIFVNGMSAVTVKTPMANALFAPGSDLTLTAVATHPSGVINRVQFFANGRLLGEGSLSAANTYSFNWKGLQRGTYSIAAIAIDGSDVPTVSTAVKFIVGRPPEVAIIAPIQPANNFASTNVSISARAKQENGSIRRVDFYANNHLIGSASDIATETFRFTWRNVPAGNHTLKAVAINDLGVSETSKLVTLSIEKTAKSH
ncbi:MAG TPA: Ig-like domain-containing protein [Pyrinomonadaceae bacterium]|nr:Ig-like domain-containing protein [Pyrinomonadaceae bacterium]